MRKRAQSQIITTILLILIVLAAVIVVWVIVNNFLDPISDDAAVMCVEVKLNIVKADSTTDIVTVTRLAGGEEADASGMKFLINGVAAAVSAVDGTSCTDDCPLGVGLIETKSVTLGNFVEGDEITVAAQVGDNKYVCNLADSTKAVGAEPPSP